MDKVYKIIVGVNLEYEVLAKNEQEARVEAENIELPKNYVEDSFEIMKIEIEGE